MSRSTIELATGEHDSEIVKLMADVPMPGKIPVTFRRAPSYFQGSLIQGDDPKVIIARDKDSGELVGVGARVEKDLFVNGVSTNCGYLCDLRIKESHRNAFALGRGYRLLHLIHKKDPRPYYLTVIYGDNVKALSSLVGSRAGLPEYQYLGLIHTPAIFLDRTKPEIKLPDVTFCKPTSNQMSKVLSFLNKELSEKQFTTGLHDPTLASSNLQGLAASDFYLAIKNNEIIGVLATWDQSGVRQVVVEKYPAFLNGFRPIYNTLSSFFSLRRIPDAGERLPFLYVSFIAVQNNNVDIFRGLFRFMYRDRHKGPWSFLVLGIHERDSLLEVVNEYRKIDTYGNLFLVNYSDHRDQILNIDSRIPYFEMACA